MEKRGKATARSSNWRKGNRKTGSVDSIPVTHKEAFGGRKKVPNDPPSHPQAPWNSLVITKIHAIGSTSKSGLVNTGDLVSWMMNQMDTKNSTFSKSAVISLKILSVSVWNLTGNYVTLAAWDYSSDTQDEDALGSWVDSGSKDHSPKLGYTWPMSNRQRPLSNSASTTQRRVFTVHASNDDKILQHIHVLWRPNAIEMSLTAQIANLDTLNKAIRAVSAANSRIYRNMPGLVPFLGAAKVAIVPIPAANQAEQHLEFQSEEQNDQERHIEEGSTVDVNYSAENIAHQTREDLLVEVARLRIQLDVQNSGCSSFCEEP